MADMTGQVALVTGGIRGIGLAICERLMNRGVKVAAGFTSTSPGRSTCPGRSCSTCSIAATGCWPAARIPAGRSWREWAWTGSSTPPAGTPTSAASWRTWAHSSTAHRKWWAERFLKTTGADPAAMLLVLGTNTDTPREALAQIGTPVLVLAGAEDNDNGSAEELAAALPAGQHATVPGNHMSAVTRPELGRAIAEFLQSGPRA
jgi:pimeloyl-ACP methyl ester carboxylesterase